MIKRALQSLIALMMNRQCDAQYSPPKKQKLTYYFDFRQMAATKRTR